MILFRALVIPFPVNIFRNIEALNVPNNIPRNLPTCIFISFFTVSVISSSNTPELSSNS